MIPLVGGGDDGGYKEILRSNLLLINIGVCVCVFELKCSTHDKSRNAAVNCSI